MEGKTNVAGSKLFAAIGVTYPAGSTVTCTNGAKTLTAKTTSGQWVFAIPEAGTWTVTATDGTSAKSQSVSITKEGQFESVKLSYRFTLYSNGDQCADLTGGWEARAAAAASHHTVALSGAVSFDSNKMRYTDSKDYGAGLLATIQKVDLTDISTLQFTYGGKDYYVADTWGSWFGIWAKDSDVNTQFPPKNAAAFVNLSEATESRTDTLDVSNISGSYYVGFGVVHWYGGSAEFNVYDVGEAVTA